MKIIYGLKPGVIFKLGVLGACPSLSSLRHNLTPLWDKNLIRTYLLPSLETLFSKEGKPGHVGKAGGAAAFR